MHTSPDSVEEGLDKEHESDVVRSGEESEEDNGALMSRKSRHTNSAFGSYRYRCYPDTDFPWNHYIDGLVLASSSECNVRVPPCACDVILRSDFILAPRYLDTEWQ